MTVPLLVWLIRGKRWSEAIHRVALYPSEAQHRDFDDPVLFRAIRMGAPVGVVDAILEAFPEAQYECYDYRSRSMGHILREPTCVGRTVVHEAAMRSPHPQVLARLLQGYPASCLKRDGWGRTPLQLLCHYSFSRGVVRSRERMTDEFRCVELKKACILVQAMVHGTVNEGGFSTISLLKKTRSFVLHDLVSCSKYIEDLELIRYAITKFPKELLQQDKDGSTPLHIACFVEGTQDGNNAVNALVAACPQAAKLKNKNGELPLCLAIQHGKHDLLALVNAYPAAIAEIEEQTGRYPFLEAASLTDCRDSVKHLTSIYALLKACPEMNRFYNNP